MAIDIGRREFISALGGVVVTWPLAVHAQQVGRILTVGVLWHAGSAEQEQPYFGALLEGFKDLGYVEGKTSGWSIAFPMRPPSDLRAGQPNLYR